MNTKKRLYPSQADARKERARKAKLIATQGEETAAKFLASKSYEILSRNFRAARAGEIDIVAIDPQGILVFVEVKTRCLEGSVYGIPEAGFEAVGYLKQQKIKAAAQVYFSHSEGQWFHWRYDVVVVILRNEGNETCETTHVANAFF